MKIVVYSLKGCPYCDKLKEQLTNDGYEFEDVDVETEDGDKRFQKIYELSKKDLFPTITVDEKILVPEISFNKIETVSKILKHILNEKKDD